MPPVMRSPDKRCAKCSSDGPFGYDRTRADGLSVYCLPCKARRSLVERIGQDLWCHGVAQAAHRRRYRENPDAQKARVALTRAVKAGKLAKLHACENCDAGPTEAHHFLGYAREHWLTVRWLCRSCHHMYHRRGWAA